MKFVSLLSDVVAEFKKLGEGENLTSAQILYMGLIVGKITGLLNMPWCLVFVLPMASPAHIKTAYGALVGAFHKVVEAMKG